MSLHRILPVIDLKRGQVVHGVAGQRETYRPITSQLVGSISPPKVAKAICDFVSVPDVYVADLDAIAGDAPEWNNYAAISNTGVEIWLDAGTGDSGRVRDVLAREPRVRSVIIALESLVSLRSLASMISEVFDHQANDFRPGRLVFSLDLQANVPVTRDPYARKLSAETIASFAIDAGIQSMIVLDVAEVGGSRGATTVDLCRKVKARYPNLELISGGGVRDMRDVQRFVDAGCDRVLVATALHHGAIN
jgi:phosphoribosylformimino-5-aminoimidazole carboxamide ribotide isomerase